VSWLVGRQLSARVLFTEVALSITKAQFDCLVEWASRMPQFLPTPTEPEVEADRAPCIVMYRCV
jgi:hypothetical protein